MIRPTAERWSVTTRETVRISSTVANATICAVDGRRWCGWRANVHKTWTLASNKLAAPSAVQLFNAGGGHLIKTWPGTRGSHVSHLILADIKWLKMTAHNIGWRTLKRQARFSPKLEFLSGGPNQGAPTVFCAQSAVTCARRSIRPLPLLFAERIKEIIKGNMIVNGNKKRLAGPWHFQDDPCSWLWNHRRRKTY